MADNTCHTIEKCTLYEFIFSTFVPLYVSDTVSETSKFQDLDMANLYLWNTKYHCDSSKTVLCYDTKQAKTFGNHQPSRFRIFTVMWKLFNGIYVCVYVMNLPRVYVYASRQ